MIRKYINYLKRQQNIGYEMLWSDIWHDTIKGLDWIQELGSISPGRAAVGYNYLYVMTRILEEKKPQRILDIGLGISSTLISQYFEYYGNENSEHAIIEHDRKWSEFYLANHRLSRCSRVHFFNRVTQTKAGHEYYAYDDFARGMNGKRFSVISIDAPHGGKKNIYARRDILPLIPDILDTSWVILIDDAERHGEKNTIKDIEKTLANNGIGYCVGLYKGATHLCVIASEDNKFLCSL